MRIAMWSGPRNLSTAMMYAFGNRADFAAWDEPFYAAYLKETGVEHPMGDTIIATHESDPAVVAARCSGPIPNGKENMYMKHMPLHMLPDFPMEWAAACVNVHLIRHPARVIASYRAKRENPTAHDIGFEAQSALFDRHPGPVIDTVDIRRDPEGMLQKLCGEIGLKFDPAMLTWPVGPKPFDGVWASHWYGAVHRSSGISGEEGPLPQVEDVLLDGALPHYRRLYDLKL